MSPVEEAKDIQPAVDVNRFLSRVRRRVFAGRLLGNASLDLIVSASVLAGLLLADRALFPGLVTWKVAGAVLLASIAVSLARTLAWNRLDALAAAVLADGRLRLKERVSSAVYVRGANRVGGGLRRLIESDAARSLEGVAVPASFPVRPPRFLAWVVLPLSIAGGLCLWLPSLDLLGIGGRKEATAREKNAVEEEKKKLDEKLAEMAKKAEERNLPDAKKVLELLAAQAQNPEKKEASGPQKADKAAGDPRREALVAMTRREDAIKKGLEGKKFEPLKDALKALKTLDLKSPEVTKRLQEALKDGDFEKAKKAMEELQKELADLSQKKPSELTGAEKARLEKLAAELSKLAKDSKSLSRLSSALSKASAQLSSSSFSEALESLEKSGEDLESLSKLADEMSLLDQALELVQLSKEDLAALQSCPECGTPYCKDCGKPQCSCKPGSKPGGT